MMTFEQVMAVFARREKCFASFKGHNADIKYVITRNGTYVTTCGDHLSRGIDELRGQTIGDNRLDVTVWVKP